MARPPPHCENTQVLRGAIIKDDDDDVCFERSLGPQCNSLISKMIVDVMIRVCESVF